MACELGDILSLALFHEMYCYLPEEKGENATRNFIMQPQFLLRVGRDIAKHTSNEPFNLDRGITGIQDYLEAEDNLYLVNRTHKPAASLSAIGTGCANETTNDDEVIEVTFDAFMASLNPAQ